VSTLVSMSINHKNKKYININLLKLNYNSNLPGKLIRLKVVAKDLFYLKIEKKIIILILHIKGETIIHLIKEGFQICTTDIKVSKDKDKINNL
jgi:hypothetical protein